jgi:hypothetical protein
MKLFTRTSIEVLSFDCDHSCKALSCASNRGKGSTAQLYEVSCCSMHNDHSLRKALGKSDCLHQTASLTLLVSFAADSELAEFKHKRAIRCATKIMLASRQVWLFRVIMCALTSCSLHVALPLQTESSLNSNFRSSCEMKLSVCRGRANQEQLCYDARMSKQLSERSCATGSADQLQCGVICFDMRVGCL